MIAATCFSLLFVPSFFVIFQSLSEMSGTKRDESADNSPEDDAEALSTA
jgi:hypothetical protein